MQRILTGAILIALLIFVIAIGGWFFALVATAAFCIALYEEYRLLKGFGHKIVAWPAFATAILSTLLVLLFS